jgi:phosphoribosylaminoimidazole carboxylase PurE protein
MDVALFIGSESDFEVVKDGLETLKTFGVAHALEITSAHRSPERTIKLVRDYEERGVSVFIAVAGKAAHLAGVVAAHTVRPVIGVPVESGGLGGLDALLSTVQMPKGVPVATMGVGKTGASNAAILAVEILALKDPALAEKLLENRRKQAAGVAADSEKLKTSL